MMIISNIALITKLDQLSMKVDQLIAQGNDRTPDLVIVKHTTTKEFHIKLLATTDTVA